MSSNNSWSKFRSELLDRLDALSLTSRVSTKFEECAAWLAEAWGFRPDEVVCKYVQHPKNRWNRLREASRKNPKALLLLFEGSEHGELETHVEEVASLCSSLSLVVVLVRHPGRTWEPSALLTRAGVALPLVLQEVGAEVIRADFAGTLVSHDGPLPPLPTLDASKLRSSLLRLSASSGESATSARSDVLDALASLTGLSRERMGFKTIPSTKNLGNRIGEALGRRLDVLVVVCPELLRERVVEELSRWDSASETATLLVLCGEETTFEVSGRRSKLTDRLKAVVEPSPQPEQRHAAPAASGPWNQWRYDDWNDHLVDYYLRASADEADPVERLAATPDELAYAVGASPEEAGTVASAFVRACVSQLPKGKSFCSFCREYDWSPASSEEPPFFGMLLLTCLIAYGYPSAEGGFHQRLEKIIGNSDITCLPGLWRDVRKWTRTHANWRELVLPPDDRYRTTIGNSHFLAFPHEHDRRRLARVLIEANLVGFEPPITPVIAALQRERKEFSAYFQQDLEHFIERYVNGNQDPRSSAFWRAVRQEALQPSPLPGGRRTRKRMTTLLGVFDDEGFLPFLGCTELWHAPPGIEVKPLDRPIGGFEYFAESADLGCDGILSLLFESSAFLGPGPRALMSQGVLVFQEDQADEYYLVSGHDVAGADVALVREDLARAFVATFGGVAEPSRVTGWQEVTKCRVCQVNELPEALSGVVQLLRTMNPPTLRFVGGVQVPGGYLGLEGLLPRVRAPGAQNVVVDVAGSELACARVAESEWALPAALAEGPLPGEFVVAGEWPSASGGNARRNERTVQLRSAVVSDEFKPLVGGAYFMESCCPGQHQVAAGEALPSLISADNASSTYDLLDCEPSARFLGPGLGEMSLSPAPGADWLAVGPKNAPELLVFVGDPANPNAPANRRSPDSGDRRHWKKAFGNAKAVVVRTEDGEYFPLERFSSLASLRDSYSRHNPPKTAPSVTETRLDTLSFGPPGRRATSPETIGLMDALAALSTQQGGLRYRTVQMLVEDLVGLADPFLHHQLIRAWAESGVVDIVRHQTYGATRVVARRPRFVAVRRGPQVEASLLGLVTTARRKQVERAANAAGVQIQSIEAGCPWQAPVLRLRASWEDVRMISAAADLASPEWLLWGVDGELHDTLRVDIALQGLRNDPTPRGYSVALNWDWDRREFVRGGPPKGPVSVEQRVHPQACSIFVVVVDEEVVAWTYIRNWALLCAYEAAGLAPFVVDPKGWVTTCGRSPVYLPLPIGRLCTVVGEGVPGPVLEHSGTVGGYCYPFGRRMTALVSRVLPAAWTSTESK